MSIKEFAGLAGVSVRTLHYYDETGRLKPAFVDEHYYTCTNDILKGLGQMYIADERFKSTNRAVYTVFLVCKIFIKRILEAHH